jgi:hypothetical protein
MKKEISSNNLFDLDVAKCGYILLKEEQLKRTFFYIYVLTSSFFRLCFGRQIFLRIRSVVVTIAVVWLLNRYYTDHQLEYPVDLFTVYLLV